MKAADAETRRQAISIISVEMNLTNRQHLPLLLNALADKAPAVRIAAVKGMQMTPTPAVQAALVRLLLREQDAHVRQEAARVLAWLWIPEQSSTAVLQPLLVSSDPSLRIIGLSALCNYHTAQTLPIALRMVKDSTANVRAAAVEQLGKMQNPSALEAVLHAVHDPDPAVGSAAIEAIKSRSEARCLAPLLAIVDDQKAPLREKALAALHGHNEQAVITRLLHIAGDQHDSLHAQALAALDISAGKPLVDQLLTMLPAAPPELHSGILQILADSADPRLADIFLPLLENADAGRRTLALRALSHSTDPRVASALAARLKTKVTVADLEAILQYQQQYREIVDQWGWNDFQRDVLKEKEGKESCQLALTLIGIGDPAIDACAALLDDAEPLIRASGAALLLNSLDRRSIPRLLTALKDNDTRVRRLAASALRRRADLSTLPAFQQAVHDADLQVRVEALRALGDIEDMRAEPALESALDAGSVDEQLAAAVSLWQLGDSHAAPAMLELLHDTHDDLLRAVLLNTLGEWRDPAVAEDALAALSSMTMLRRRRSLCAGATEGTACDGPHSAPCSRRAG